MLCFSRNESGRSVHFSWFCYYPGAMKSRIIRKLGILPHFDSRHFVHTTKPTGRYISEYFGAKSPSRRFLGINALVGLEPPRTRNVAGLVRHSDGILRPVQGDVVRLGSLPAWEWCNTYSGSGMEFGGMAKLFVVFKIQVGLG